MKTSLKTLAVGALAALFLVGCGGGQDTQAPAETTAQDTTTQETESQQAPATQTQGQEAEISLDEAKAIALEHAGLAEADVVYDDTDYETENGRAIYEISFDIGNQEYEYDIDATTGEILKSEVDNN